MSQSDDGYQVRQALAEMTASQPPAPADRYLAVKRRAAGRRRSQLLSLGAAALAVAATVFGLPAAFHPPPQARSVPEWALPWPDHRNGSVPQSVLNWAVRAWAAPSDWLLSASYWRIDKLPKIPKAVWYVGQTMADRQLVVVVFEANHRLVTGSANAPLVMGGIAACLAGRSACWTGDPWKFTSAPAPAVTRAGLVIGLNVHRSVTFEGTNPDNWIVLLTRPDVRTVAWQASTLTGPVTGRSPASDGLAVADTGHVTAPVRITGLFNGSGNNELAQPEDVGVPGEGPAVPELAMPSPIRVPGHLFVLGSGLGSELDQEPLLDGLDENATVSRARDGLPAVSYHLPSPEQVWHGRYKIYASCYGPGPLRVTFFGHLVGTMTCDNRPQKVTWLVPHQIDRLLAITVSTSAHTRWQLYLQMPVHH